VGGGHEGREEGRGEGEEREVAFHFRMGGRGKFGAGFGLG
jgi:hypothetical protein